jgi:RimJ/RimL family protein N-acetyltransferase
MWLQPQLSNSVVSIQPLKVSDFEALFALASDPDVWAQHPNPERYKREVFEVYFQGAMESSGAFLVRNAQTQEVIGCSRYYDYKTEERSILIGYTFLGKAFWGGTFNPALKELMLDHAFQFVDRVFFHVGKVNRRSQMAMERLGALLVEEAAIAYHGEKVQPNFIYQIRKEEWFARKREA